MTRLYLASKSPRRREILASMGISDIEVITVGPTQRTAFEGDETILEGEAPADYVVRTARTKAQQAREIIKEHGLVSLPLLAADTVVIAADEILGKPADRNEARRFMQTLSGRTHEVRTAVCVINSKGEMFEAVNVSSVRFTELSPEQIEAYITTDEPYDKAGGYAVQGLAGLFIDHIEGSYSGVMGLPVFETAKLLRLAAPGLVSIPA